MKYRIIFTCMLMLIMSVLTTNYAGFFTPDPVDVDIGVEYVLDDGLYMDAISIAPEMNTSDLFILEGRWDFSGITLNVINETGENEVNPTLSLKNGFYCDRLLLMNALGNDTLKPSLYGLLCQTSIKQTENQIMGLSRLDIGELHGTTID